MSTTATEQIIEQQFPPSTPRRRIGRGPAIPCALDPEGPAITGTTCLLCALALEVGTGGIIGCALEEVGHGAEPVAS